MGKAYHLTIPKIDNSYSILLQQLEFACNSMYRVDAWHLRQRICRRIKAKITRVTWSLHRNVTWCPLPNATEVADEHSASTFRVKNKIFSQKFGCRMWGKFTPEHAMKAQRGSSYTYTLPLTSVLDGRGGQRHAAAALSQEIDQVPIVWESGWAPKLVWTCAKKCAPIGIRSPDLSVGIESRGWGKPHYI